MQGDRSGNEPKPVEDARQVGRHSSTSDWIAQSEGASLKDCVRLTVYVGDLHRFAPMVDKAQAELWGGPPYPPRTMIEVQRLFDDDIVEIDSVFYAPMKNSNIRIERKMQTKVTIPALSQMKREGEKSVGVVAWDYQIARIADRAGVDIVSVGNSVGVNLWGHANPLEVTMEEMLVVCKAVRRGVTRALVSCDFPFGPCRRARKAPCALPIRLVKEGGADMVKLDGASEFPDAVRAIVRAGIPVFAQFGLTPQTALRYGIPYSAQASPQAQATAEMTAKLVEEAKLLKPRVPRSWISPIPDRSRKRRGQAVSIPVIGGFGGGPWLDGRIRLAHTAIGYGEKWIDAKTETYANVAKISLDRFTALIADVRAGRQIKG